MKQSPIRLVLSLGLVTCALFHSFSSIAALGDKIESVENDRQALSALAARSSIRKSFTVRILQTDTNTIREYVSPAGIVFGVAWNGMTQPDLTQLLGSYSGEYQRALSSTRRVLGQRRRAVRSDNVVVEKWGHMRNLSGRAFDPSLLPEGVSPDEIQ